MNRITTISAGLVLVSALIAGSVSAQAGEDEDVEFQQRRLNGPRLGMTYVVPGENSQILRHRLEDADVGNLISQFGWHFEWLVSPQGGGPSFVVQLVPFVGGVEYGTVIPTTSLVMGIRLPVGFEFGMGPHILFAPTMNEKVASALVVGVGKSIDFRGVSIPLNLALTTNRDGNRVSFVFGYAIPRKSKESER